MRKILFFDIDDTLTSELDGTIPVSAIEAIKRVRAAGHLAWVNTGRCVNTLSPRMADLEFDGYICGCGTEILNGKLEPIWETPRPDCMEELIAASQEAGADLLLEGRLHTAFLPFAVPTTLSAAHHRDDFARKGIRLSDPHQEGFSFSKFCVWVHEREDIRPVLRVTDSRFTCIDRGFRRNTWLFEFIPKECSKAIGMQQVCDMYGIPITDSYAFGDSNNDLPMFEAAGHRIAMGNSTSERIRQMADYITGKASEDGLAQALDLILR